MTMLKTQKREKSQNAKAILSEGNIPIVFYGPKEKTASAIVSGKEFGKVLKEAGESTVITLDTSNGKKSALIHDIQFDPIKSTPIHVDFYVVEEGKDVEVNVPLEFVGVATAIKELGGSLVKVMHELAVKGKPADLPHSIEIDISSLETLDSNISSNDVALPKGITLTSTTDDIVASISVTKEEEEVPVADISDIEVEQKGKKDDEEEAEGGEEKS